MYISGKTKKECLHMNNDLRVMISDFIFSQMTEGTSEEKEQRAEVIYNTLSKEIDNLDNAVTFLIEKENKGEC